MLCGFHEEGYTPGDVYATYVPEIKMKIEPEWRDWQPAGYTDDLGIIADRNQWVNEVLPGWYIKIPQQMALEVHDWCNANLQGRWQFAAGIPYRMLYISDDKDLSWFTLKWS